jgi:hypothetical protein
MFTTDVSVEFYRNILQTAVTQWRLLRRSAEMARLPKGVHQLVFEIFLVSLLSQTSKGPFESRSDNRPTIQGSLQSSIPDPCCEYVSPWYLNSKSLNQLLREDHEILETITAALTEEDKTVETSCNPRFAVDVGALEDIPRAKSPNEYSQVCPCFCPH